MVYSEKFDAYLFESLEEVESSSDSSHINEYVFKKISSLINEDKDNVVLFYIRVDGVIYSTTINRNSALAPLQKCLEKFISFEDYENCLLCDNLIRCLRI
jgi:hypothetical protein